MNLPCPCIAAIAAYSSSVHMQNYAAVNTMLCSNLERSECQKYRLQAVIHLSFQASQVLQWLRSAKQKVCGQCSPTWCILDLVIRYLQMWQGPILVDNVCNMHASQLLSKFAQSHDTGHKLHKATSRKFVSIANRPPVVTPSHVPPRSTSRPANSDGASCQKCAGRVCLQAQKRSGTRACNQ